MSRPFMEYVHPNTGAKHRVYWDNDRAYTKQQEFIAEAIEFFRKQDIERARAVGIEIADDAPGLPTCTFETDGAFAVDVLASKIKHAGVEVTDRWVPRWQEFCAKPQNEEDAEYPMVTHRPRQVTVEALDSVAPQNDSSRKIDYRTRAGRLAKRELANV